MNAPLIVLNISTHLSILMFFLRALIGGLLRASMLGLAQGMDVWAGAGPQLLGWLRASTFGLTQGLNLWVGSGPQPLGWLMASM